MHNITSDQRAIPDLSYTCKWLSSLFPGKIFISVHFSGSQSLRKKNLILRFPVNLTSGIYFCLCWWKWSENENDMNLHQKTMSHYCRNPAEFVICSESVRSVLSMAVKMLQNLSACRKRYLLNADIWNSTCLFYSELHFSLLTLLYKGSIHKPHGVVESRRCHWSHL